jgi:hypothetical protein
MKAKSIRGNNFREIETTYNQVLADNFKPTLAIVFISIKQNIDEVSQFLQEKNIEVFGATTNGEFIDEELGKESITIMLMDLPRDYYHLSFAEYPGRNYLEIAAGIARKAMEKFSNPVFLLAGSHMETDAEELLLGFQEVIGQDANVFGAMAGDDFTFKEQFIFTQNQKSNEGVVVLSMDGDKVDLKGRALCGWKAAGTEKTVTKSEGNRVYTIDGITALDITAKFGGLKNVTEENQNTLFELATLCPLQMQRENGPAVMRPGLIINWQDRSFFCSGKVPQGSKVKFSLPPDFDAIEEVIQGCKELKEDIPEADAIIYFTCAGRLLTFGPLMSQEIQGIQEVWNAPMIGMFSNSELGRAKGGNLEMHNLSSNVVVIREKED